MKRLYMDHIRTRRFRGGQQIRGINLSDADFARLDGLVKKGMRSALIGFSLYLVDLVTPDDGDRDEQGWRDELKTGALDDLSLIQRPLRCPSGNGCTRLHSYYPRCCWF